MADDDADLLQALRSFVRDEHAAARHQLHETWSRPLDEKLERGLSQGFVRLERGEDAATLWARLDGRSDSRFREGDLLALHRGSVFDAPLGHGLVLEAEDDDRWLLRGTRVQALLQAAGDAPCYADPDTLDLTPFYERALNEISTSTIGRQVVLPLLDGTLEISFDDRDVEAAARTARAEGFNAAQAEAVGLAVGADQVACIQGPPGTGKTRVLALVVRLLVARGERVLVTSHTHTAINNALNKVHAQGVPCVKVGRDTQRRGLDEAVPCCPSLLAWRERPTNGYAVGATPFATCTTRLDGHEFDSVVFDEASQITLPLALMAMRKGRRFVFVGDQKQLPPVVLSRSVLDPPSPSVFARLTRQLALRTTLLDTTYRMNRWLTAWPSRQYYAGRLVAAGANRERQLVVPGVADALAPVFEPAASGVFVPTLDRSARTLNLRDARFVLALCQAALQGGLAAAQIGIVTPYRAQGRALRQLLEQQLGRAQARKIVADTVERMQGQERELVILSMASGEPVFLAAVAPFFFQPERLNVSITRAVSKLIVIGPEPHDVPVARDDTVNDWIGQYASLVGHLERVELPSWR